MGEQSSFDTVTYTCHSIVIVTRNSADIEIASLSKTASSHSQKIKCDTLLPASKTGIGVLALKENLRMELWKSACRVNLASQLRSIRHAKKVSL